MGDSTVRPTLGGLLVEATRRHLVRPAFVSSGERRSYAALLETRRRP